MPPWFSKTRVSVVAVGRAPMGANLMVTLNFPERRLGSVTLHFGGEPAFGSLRFAKWEVVKELTSGCHPGPIQTTHF
jgi:hypothetical protein